MTQAVTEKRGCGLRHRPSETKKCYSMKYPSDVCNIAAWKMMLLFANLGKMNVCLTVLMHGPSLA